MSSISPATRAMQTQQLSTPEPLSVPAAQEAVKGRHLLNIRRVNNPVQVLELKKILSAKGYDVGDVTIGKFDEKVLAAVAQFQADNNLTKDGLVGQQTWAALLDIPGAAQVPAGTQWLTEWNASSRQRADMFVRGAAPPEVDLRAELKPENATDAPLFRQGDERWGNRVMFNRTKLSAEGCAVTSLAMAMSGATGKEINPAELDDYLDKHQGYDVTNKVVWDVAGRAAGVGINRVSRGSIEQLDASLAAKRPVVVGVDYKRGSSTDHWVTVTGVAMDSKGQKVFLANDPATGEVIRLYANKQGGLSSYAGGMGDYRTTGDMAFVG